MRDFLYAISMIKCCVCLALLLLCTGAYANLRIKDRETQKLVSLKAADIDRIVFNFYFDPGRNTPGVECSFDGVNGIKLLKSKGFHLEKLLGIPACIIAGKFEIRLIRKRQIFKF